MSNGFFSITITEDGGHPEKGTVFGSGFSIPPRDEVKTESLVAGDITPEAEAIKADARQLNNKQIVALTQAQYGNISSRYTKIHHSTLTSLTNRGVLKLLSSDPRRVYGITDHGRDVINWLLRGTLPTAVRNSAPEPQKFPRYGVLQAIIEGIYLDNAGVMIINGSRVYPKRGDLRIAGDTIEYHWKGTNDQWVPLHENSIVQRAKTENLAFADEPNMPTESPNVSEPPKEPGDTEPIPPNPPAPLPTPLQALRDRTIKVAMDKGLIPRPDQIGKPLGEMDADIQQITRALLYMVAFVFPGEQTPEEIALFDLAKSHQIEDANTFLDYIELLPECPVAIYAHEWHQERDGVWRNSDSRTYPVKADVCTVYRPKGKSSLWFLTYESNGVIESPLTDEVEGNHIAAIFALEKHLGEV